MVPEIGVYFYNMVCDPSGDNNPKWGNISAAINSQKSTQGYRLSRSALDVQKFDLTFNNISNNAHVSRIVIKRGGTTVFNETFGVTYNRYSYTVKDLPVGSYDYEVHPRYDSGGHGIAPDTSITIRRGNINITENYTVRIYVPQGIK